MRAFKNDIGNSKEEELVKIKNPNHNIKATCEYLRKLENKKDKSEYTNKMIQRIKYGEIYVDIKGEIVDNEGNHYLDAFINDIVSR